MRAFRATDLLWLEGIAKAENEWPQLLRGLEVATTVVVEEPYAIAALYVDEHGVGLAALSGREGIKQMIRISEFLKTQVLKSGVSLHGHWTPGSWQSRVAIKRGFKIGENGYHVIEGA